MQTHDLIPMSRASILRYTQLIRSKLGIPDAEPYVDIVRVLEFFLPKYFPDLRSEILSVEEMGEHHGLTYPNRNLILIREDVYDGACQGRGRDRFTIAHEIGHLLLHEGVDPRYARRDPMKPVPAYLDPEWQSNAFAGYLLMSPHAIQGMTPSEVATACGVSYEAATVQLKILAKK